MKKVNVRICEETRTIHVWEREIWLRWREKAINALTNLDIEGNFSDDFIKFMNTYIHDCPNKNQTETKYWPSQQKFNKRFRIEMFSIREEFWPKKWSEIIKSLNKREKIYDYTWSHEIGMNINSGDFYRDANYNLSIYDKERKSLQ
jgi:hypothetical protein